MPKGLSSHPRGSLRAQEIASAKGIEHIPFTFDVDTGDFTLRHKTKLFAGLSSGFKVGHSGNVVVLRADGTTDEWLIDPNS